MNIELRWLLPSAYPHTSQGVLQYRVLLPAIDASGSFCPGGDWSQWKAVQRVFAQKTEAAVEQLSDITLDMEELCKRYDSMGAGHAAQPIHTFIRRLKAL